MNDNGSTSQTIPALWREATTTGRTGTAWVGRYADGWAPVSWDAAAERVEALGNGLLDIGVGRGDRVAILGSTSVEWAALDFALLSIGAVVVPIYPTSSASEVEHILVDSGSTAAFVDDSRMAELEPLRHRFAGVKHLLAFSGSEALADRGRRFAALHPDAFGEAGDAVSADDVFTCIYTSGTTGPPKGCLLTHRNEVAMATTLAELPDLVRPGDRTVLFLPLAHNFGRLIHITAAKIGFTVAFCPDPAQLREALAEVRPHFLPSVPRIWEKLHDAIVTKVDAAGGPRGALARWAIRVGRDVSARRLEGAPVPAGLALRHVVADRLVLKKIRAGLGGELRLGFSGAAPISVEVLEFFHGLGILILEGYGLTECTTATVNMPGSFRFGTVGKPLPGCTVGRADDGEILLSGDGVFTGYHHRPDDTDEAFDADGRFRTGDIGELDRDGFLRITDRKKDLIATSAGKKVAPQHLEGLLRSSALVSQALIVGDLRPYITALVTLDPERFAAWAASAGVDPASPDAVELPELRDLVQAAVDAANRELARPEQIKRFAIVPREFTAEHGEVTPTLKLKRRVCEQHFAAEIESLYDAALVAA